MLQLFSYVNQLFNDRTFQIQSCTLHSFFLFVKVCLYSIISDMVTHTCGRLIENKTIVSRTVR